MPTRRGFLKGLIGAAVGSVVAPVLKLVPMPHPLRRGLIGFFPLSRPPHIDMDHPMAEHLVGVWVPANDGAWAWRRDTGWHFQRFPLPKGA